MTTGEAMTSPSGHSPTLCVQWTPTTRGRTPMLSNFCKKAVTSTPGFYNAGIWEVSPVGGSPATVAMRMTAEHGHRVTHGAEVERVTVSPQGCTARLASGEQYTADAVVLTISAGPLRRIRIDGLSTERRASLDHQRHALASKVTVAHADSFWARDGLNGSAYNEVGMLGGTWVQRHGILSVLVPPERQGAFLATFAANLHGELTDELVATSGPKRANNSRSWCVLGRPARSRSGTSLAGGRATLRRSTRCKARMSRRSTPPAATSGCAAVWKVP